MAYERRDFSGSAVETTLAGGITNVATSFVVASATGWPTGSDGDFFARIEDETIRCASRSGTSVTVASSGRGADGTTAVAHTSGVVVSHVISGVDVDEANWAVSQTVGKVTTKGDLLVATAANTLARVGVGSNGLPLVGASGQTAGMEFAQLGTAGLADGAVTTAKIAGAGWTTFAPTVAGITSIGNGAVGAKYIRTAEDLIVYKGRIRWGSTTTVPGAAEITVTLPVNALSTASDVGSVVVYEVGVDGHRDGSCWIDSQTVLGLAAGDGNVTSAFPITFGADDEIRWTITYEPDA